LKVLPLFRQHFLLKDGYWGVKLPGQANKISNNEQGIKQSNHVGCFPSSIVQAALSEAVSLIPACCADAGHGRAELIIFLISHW
jgi:hypothetical protein